MLRIGWRLNIQILLPYIFTQFCLSGTHPFNAILLSMEGIGSGGCALCTVCSVHSHHHRYHYLRRGNLLNKCIQLGNMHGVPWAPQNSSVCPGKNHLQEIAARNWFFSLFISCSYFLHCKK